MQKRKLFLTKEKSLLYIILCFVIIGRPQSGGKETYKFMLVKVTLLWLHFAAGIKFRRD